MVVISLYRGNLHRAADIPCRWLMPTPKISLKDFKSLLHRRDEAISRLRSISSSSSPNPYPDLKPQVQSSMPNGPLIQPNLEAQVEPEPPLELRTGPPSAEVKVVVVGGSNGGDCSLKPEDEQPEKDVNLQEDEKTPEETKANLGVSKKVNEVNESNRKEKRKREIEEKLQVLNAQKHNFVQVLKQILNTEEELKRRNSMQGTAICPAVPLQVETTNDFGSMNRLVNPRIGLEANVAVENEGGEADDVSNADIYSRHVFRMSSTSPSSEYPLRKPTCIQCNLVPHPYRASMGITGSPSCFASIGNQGHLGNPPPVSVSGTNCVASSPSPAAVGGTSVFREAQQPSPWN